MPFLHASPSQAANTGTKRPKVKNKMQIKDRMFAPTQTNNPKNISSRYESVTGDLSVVGQKQTSRHQPKPVFVCSCPKADSQFQPFAAQGKLVSLCNRGG
jgi:hypothetical protein